LSDGEKIQIKLHSNSFLNQEEFELNTRWMKRGDRVGKERNIKLHLFVLSLLFRKD